MEANDYGAVDSNGNFDNRGRYVGSNHGSNQSSLHHNDFPSSRAETPINDPRQAVPHVRSLSETLQLFQNAVDSSRAAAVKSNAESEAMESSISLNVDLKNKSIGVLPDEVVDVMKKDHGRIIGLILTGNFIKNLPPRLSECSQLTYLNLRSNSISDFPPVILTLSKLEVLDVSRNSLSSIPEDIQKMKKLRFLSIRNNRLVDLPKSLGSADHLRVIKLDGNPLSEALWSIVNGNQVQTSSPQNVLVNENDIAVEVTRQIKNHLRESSRQTDSEMGSQSESTLETPKISRRTSVRFPVKLANGSSSENGTEPRSPNVAKPAIPTRSKQRIFSVSNGTSQAVRYSEVESSSIANERNRSQSESIVQSSPTVRHKRMGLLSAKKLDSLEESNRNSLHLRGTSHASALRDRQKIYKTALGSGSSTSASPHDTSTSGIFLRRLSSVPERRSDSLTSRRIVEVAKGLVYALHMFDPTLSIMLSVIGDAMMTGRTSLHVRYGTAISLTNTLDQDLSAFEAKLPRSRKAQKRVANLIKTACAQCMIAYKQVFEGLLECTSPLVAKADRRYLRTLMLIFYGSCNEAFNGVLSAVPQDLVPSPESVSRPRTAPTQQPPRLTIQAANSSRSGTPLSVIDGGRTISQAISQASTLVTSQTVSQGPFSAPARRMRSDTTSSSRSGGTIKPPPMPQSALPAYARSRSNSRSNHFGSALSMSNVPRSGEPFSMQPSTALQTNHDYEHVELERVYTSISSTITQCRNKMSELIVRIEHRKSNLHLRREREACQRMITKFTTLKTACETIHKQMVKVKLNDPDIRRFKELCQTFINYASEWESFLTSMVPEKKAHPDLWSATDMKDLRPLHERHKLGTSDAQSYLHRRNNSQHNWRVNGTQSSLGPRQHGHERTGRGDSANSITSPYIPTTPLSAALGAAAQATIPAATPASATSTGSSFDRSFRGNVFERADALLNSNTLPFLRPRDRAL